jgi:hypothetical protein
MQDPNAEQQAAYSRRALVGRIVLAAGAVAGLQSALGRAGLIEEAQAASVDLVTDTLNGLTAFVVPGPDAYSVAQGEVTAEAGGVDASAGEALVQGLNAAHASQPTLAASVAALLNGIAVAVNANAASGQFASPFANLAFAEKGLVFATLEREQSFEHLRSLVGVLPGLVAFLAYSEVGVFNPATRSLVGQPVGWAIASYDGVADGRDELIGYFENRRKVDA